MPVRIVITLPNPVYKAVETALKNNKQPRQDPDNPDTVILSPLFKSVEAWIEDVIENNIAPVMANSPKSEAITLIEAEIAAKQEAMRALMKVVSGVTKEEPPV